MLACRRSLTNPNLGAETRVEFETAMGALDTLLKDFATKWGTVAAEAVKAYTDGTAALAKMRVLHAKWVPQG